jgi:hypothetical protein
MPRAFWAGALTHEPLSQALHCLFLKWGLSLCSGQHQGPLFMPGPALCLTLQKLNYIYADDLMHINIPLYYLSHHAIIE